LNLVWALAEAKQLEGAARIAVIGAGFAGLTVAIAANSKGAHVTVYEKENDVLTLQRGGTTRFIHPRIYEWPDTGSESESANLPFLSWSAGSAAEVTDKVAKEWKAHESKYQNSGGLIVDMDAK
jgi:NADPH-dependent 2,4-dienoyl-CoA reductase/sulfur reductase-like enzyme